MGMAGTIKNTNKMLVLLMVLAGSARIPLGECHRDYAEKPAAYWTSLDVARRTNGARRGLEFKR